MSERKISEFINNFVVCALLDLLKNTQAGTSIAAEHYTSPNKYGPFYNYSRYSWVCISSSE